MPTDTNDNGLAIALFSEVMAAEQMIRGSLSKTLPKGMEMSHFAVLNHLSSTGEKSPAQLARNFHVTKGAMTNTLHKLQSSGFIHIRPDWEDARKKLVSISKAGEDARESAFRAVRPVFNAVFEEIGAAAIKQVLPVLRDFRRLLDQKTH